MKSIQQHHFPEILLPKIRVLNQRLDVKKTNQTDRLSFEFSHVDDEDFLPLALLEFHGYIDEIVTDLDIVIHDMREMEKYNRSSVGSPIDRYRLLIRMYFYEYYRFREHFSLFISAAGKHQGAKKSDIRELRDAFNDVYEPIFKTRNVMTHWEPSWPDSQVHMDLLKSTESAGFAMVDLKTDKRLRWGELIADQNAEYLPLLVDAASHVVDCLQRVSNSLAEIAAGEDEFRMDTSER